MDRRALRVDPGPTRDSRGSAAIVADIEELRRQTPTTRDPVAFTQEERVSMAMAGATALFLMFSDDDLELSTSIHSEGSHSAKDVAVFGKALGEVPLGLGILSSLGAYGAVRGDDRARLAHRTGLLSVALSCGLVVPALKEAVGRIRPNGGLGSHVFEPFSGAASFPSGHTAMAFSLGSAIHLFYPGWIGNTAVVLAATTAYSRVYTLNHWPSDVLMGAVIGYGSAHAAARLERRLARYDFSLTPVAFSDTTGSTCPGVALGHRF